MKTVLFYLFFFLACSMYAQNNKHIGTWKGVDKGETVLLTFQKDGFLIIEATGVTYGGESFEMDGQKMSVSYTIDYSSEAPGFIVLLKNLDSGKVLSKMLGTITFSDKTATAATVCMKRVRAEETKPEFVKDDCLAFTKTK